MTEAKKEYILGALNEVEDIFIAEAAEYQKSKFVWKYTKEFAMAAACAAVLFISVNALHFLPIGGTKNAGENSNAASWEKLEYKVEDSSEADIILTHSTGIIVEEIIADSTLTEENAVTAESGSEQKEETDGVCGYPMIGQLQEASCMEWMTPEELLALDIDIFVGEVLNIRSYRVSGGISEYFTVAEVRVTDSIRSDMEVGSICDIYLPFAEVNGVKMTSSLNGDLDKLEEGSKAIFMPHKATEESGKSGLNARLSYSDFADYYFGEGMRFLFLEREGELLFEENVYHVPGGKEATLDEAAQYIKDILEQ